MNKSAPVPNCHRDTFRNLYKSGGRGHRPFPDLRQDGLSKAKEIAEDWYLQLRGKLRNGEIKTEKTFREASRPVSL